MNKDNFEEIAASNFLSNDDEISINGQLLLLKENEDQIIPSGVYPWYPFENSTNSELLDNISNLAREFENVYNRGLKDGIELNNKK